MQEWSYANLIWHQDSPSQHFQWSRQPHDIDDRIREVSYLLELVNSFTPQIGCEHPLEAYLAHFGNDFDIQGQIEEVNVLLVSI